MERIDGLVTDVVDTTESLVGCVSDAIDAAESREEALAITHQVESSVESITDVS